MVAVAPRDVLAVDAMRLAVLRVRDVGRVGGDVARRHVLGFVDDRHAFGVERVVEVLGHLRLPVDHHRLAGEALEVDPQELPEERHAHAVVDEALLHHAIAEPGVAQHVDRAPLEHPRSDAGHDVVAGLAFEDDGLVAREVKAVGEQQTCRTASDDHHPACGSRQELGDRGGERVGLLDVAEVPGFERDDSALSLIWACRWSDSSTGVATSRVPATSRVRVDDRVDVFVGGRHPRMAAQHPA